METKFTQVRQARRKPEQQRHTRSSIGKNDGRVMGGGKTQVLRKEGVLEEIRVSNRFGGLEEEEEMEERVEEVVREEANKENENNMNSNSGGSRRVHGKAMTFVAAGNKGDQSIIRLGPKERKACNLRSPKFQKPKSKIVGPMRGLVYGPTRGEIDLSMSGKRLRVEKESVGRPGGAFAGDGELDGNEKSSDHAGEQRSIQAHVETAETPLMDLEPSGGQKFASNHAPASSTALDDVISELV
ncbi:hypothetical protein F2Q69_00024876 [Brassica cretica]|uniref:Uncharacterized protein n=1 Tax=Brassica cretica TaxID=69181 RepID=A0A8S9QPT9_BRACR|nr:hypothetical protein F2Q69_00024876 [Brassica cretica]